MHLFPLGMLKGNCRRLADAFISLPKYALEGFVIADSRKERLYLSCKFILPRSAGYLISFRIFARRAIARKWKKCETIFHGRGLNFEVMCLF